MAASKPQIWKHVGLLLLFGCMSLISRSQALSKRISFGVNGVTRSEALHELSIRASFDYAINPNAYRSTEKINLTEEEQTIKQQLDRILDAPNLIYKEQNGLIVVVKGKRTSYSIKNTISGLIVDQEHGWPIEGVVVRDKYVDLADTTDENGYFELTIDQIDYRLNLEFYRAGYFSREQNFKVTDSRSMTLTLRQIPPAEQPFYVIDTNRLTAPLIASAESMPFASIGRAAKSVEPSIFELKVKWAAAGVVPAWHTDPTKGSESIYRITADLLYGKYAGLKGFSFAGLVHSTDYRHDGIQIAGLVNYGRGKGGGLALAGMSNVSGLDFNGVQLAGISNYARVRMNGIQAAGITNFTNGQFQGIQVSGIYSHSKGRSKGIQASGILSVNSAGEAQMLQFGGALAVAADGLNGFQISGLSSISSDDLSGVQLSGLTAVNSGDLSGLQLAGLVSICSGQARGLQVSALSNYSGHIKGAQLTAGFNTASRMSGMQLGLVNIAGKSKGVQFGLINIVDSLDSGVSFGFLNIVGNGLFELQASYEGTGFTDLAIRTGSNSWYNILSFGYRLNDVPLYRPGYGLGFKVMHNDYVGVTIESQLYVPIEDWSSSDAHVQWNNSVGIEIRPLKRLALFGSYNYASYYTSAFNPIDGTSDLEIAPAEAVLKSYGQYGVQVWSTYTVGLRFF